MPAAWAFSAIILPTAVAWSNFAFLAASVPREDAAAKVRSLRKIEPYKGKGVRFLGEQVRRKAGKTAAK